MTKKEAEKVILENDNLIHFFVRKFGGKNPYWEYEDICQDMRLRVWRALPAFDPEKGSLSTFIGGVIRNGLWNRMRDEKRRYFPIDYLETSIYSGSYTSKDNPILLKDSIEVPEGDSSYSLIDLEDSMESCLVGREMEALTLFISGYKQREIAERLGVSQGQVSRILTEAKRKIRINYLGIEKEVRKGA